jgi:hypothetical protein
MRCVEGEYDQCVVGVLPVDGYVKNMLVMETGVPAAKVEPPFSLICTPRPVPRITCCGFFDHQIADDPIAGVVRVHVPPSLVVFPKILCLRTTSGCW